MFSRLREIMSKSTPATSDMTAAPREFAPSADRSWNKEVARTFGIRKGMWVMDKEFGLGIVQTSFDDGNVGVMLVDEHGFNKLFVTRPGVMLRQARLREIPIKRQPSPELARALGY